MPKKKGSSTKTSIPPAKVSDVMKALHASKTFSFSPEAIASKIIDVDGQKKLYPALKKDVLATFSHDKAMSDKLNAAFAAIKFGKKNGLGSEDYKKEPRTVKTSPAGTLTIPVATFFGKGRHRNSDDTANIFDKFDCTVTYNSDNSITVKLKK